MNGAGQEVAVSGCRIYFVAGGSGTPAVVLVHGLAGHLFSWRENLPAIADKRRVYALDLPGFGGSRAGDAYDYSFTAAADVIAGFCREMKEARVVLVGHSLGGAAALLCAARYPDSVERLVLLAPVNPFDTGLQRRIALGAHPVLGRFILRAAQPFTRILTAQILRRRLYANKVPDAATIRGYAEPLERANAVDVLQRTYRAWDLESLRRALPLVRQPVLLIWGERDRIVAPQSARRLGEELKAELHILPACGHLPAEECPEEVNRLIVDWL